jgi:hypothetical protein
MEQYFSLTTFQHKHQHKLNFSISEQIGHSINLCRRGKIFKTVTLQYMIQVQWLFRGHHLEFKTVTLGREPSNLVARKHRGRKCGTTFWHEKTMQVHYFFLPVTPATTCTSNKRLNLVSPIFNHMITASNRLREELLVSLFKRRRST